MSFTVQIRGAQREAELHHVSSIITEQKKTSLAQARPKLLSAQKHRDWKRSKSTMEPVPIERDKVCCTAIACLSYHKSKDSREGGKHCQHKAACSAAAGCHRGRLGTDPTEMSEGVPLQQQTEDLTFFIFTANTLLTDGS